MNQVLPTLIAKALTDTGYDLLAPAGDGWTAAAISGAFGRVRVKASGGKALLALDEPGIISRIGLATDRADLPAGAVEVGVTHGARQLYEALQLLHTLQLHPASALLARVEERLARIPETERTREVRQRIGQDVFRAALMDLWQGRCAITGIPFPPELLRASHAKPWARASDAERLDPFNGLLLAVHFDAMFDTGLIGFTNDGALIASSHLDLITRSHLLIDETLHLRTVSPGHVPYLAWHRENILRP